MLVSATGLVSISREQAADFQLKAEAVEYVRPPVVPDSTTIPCSDTCIKLGGYLRADLVISSNSEFADDFAAKSADNGARS